MVLGCHEAPAPSTAAAPHGADSPGDGAAGVTLAAAQIEKLGIVSAPVRSLQYAAEVAGFGIIQSHDAIAQAAAEWVTAQATERLSHAALGRVQKLAGTPGAVSADVQETATEKERLDSMALALTTQRLSASFGMNPPWKAGVPNATLAALASGRTKLVRATFPFGRLTGGAPKVLKATRIAADESGAVWILKTVWDAPADGAIPGRSFFALLEARDASEGERLRVTAPTGEAEAGVVVPAAAAVMADGTYWCYVEEQPGTFVRIEIDTSRPTRDGYFVTQGIGTDARVVTAGAGQLLAVESGSSAGPD
jgi:hypothetical protein